MVSITTAHTLPGEVAASEVSLCRELWLLRDMPSWTLDPGHSIDTAALGAQKLACS